MTSDWYPGRVSKQYKDNYDPIFRSEEENCDGNSDKHRCNQDCDAKDSKLD